jgi:hypothetical protein
MHKLIPENFNFSPAGPLDPAFVYADGLYAGALRPLPALSEAQRTRLVRGPKCPTAEKLLNNAYLEHKKNQFFYRSALVDPLNPSWESAVVAEHEVQPEEVPLNTIGAKTVVEFREWAEEWRIRTEVETTSGQLPPENSGARESVMLSDRAARKIADSCEYMAQCKGGYKTFVTGTLAPEARERWASGETTIQKEVSRTMDALQKMYQRGWTMSDGTRVPGQDGKLCYCWVVEVPEKDGVKNPHIHMLLGWRVPFSQFNDWAAKIEGIWGNGYFHLEKIKDSQCAGAYMAKAAGYLSKAADNEDQGLVRGNRYGISSEARAPEWVKVSEKQLHIMGRLIADIHDHMTVKYGKQYAERKKLNQKLAETPKEDKGKRKRIGERLAEVRAEIKKIPARCSKYQIVIKGLANMGQFFTWASQPDDGRIQWPEWLPEKPEGVAWIPGDDVTAADSQGMARMRAILRKIARNRLIRRLDPPKWVQWCNEQWNQFKGDYENIAATLAEQEAFA